MSEIWAVTHPATGVTLGTETTLRAAKTTAEDAYKQHAQFAGDVECYAYSYVREQATGALCQVAHDGESGWFTGVEITKTRKAGIVRRCGQCGRTGTQGFRVFPAADVIHEGAVAVVARSMAECVSKTACRKRWPKTRDEDED